MCVFVWIYVYDLGSSSFRRFRVLLCFALSLPPSSSPFLLLGSAWVSLLLFCALCRQDLVVYAGRSGEAFVSFAFFLSFLFSLPGPAPLSLALLSLSLSSFCLSFFLACISESPGIVMGLDYCNLFTSLPFIHPARRSHRVCVSVTFSDYSTYLDGSCTDFLGFYGHFCDVAKCVCWMVPQLPRNF